MSDTKENDPLRGLISESTEEINRAQLAGLLKPYAAFSKSGDVTFLPEFYKLGNASKVLVVLTAQKARHLLFEDEFTTDAMSSSEIIALEVMAEGSVKSTVKRLLEKTHDIKRNSDKKYYIPNYQLNNLDEAISSEEK